MRIFNSLSGKKELLKKPKKGFLKLFVCGPTVYDYSHIGHARTYLVFDAIVRYLRARGFKVFYLQNITDVDDKIIARAEEGGKSPFEVARAFEKAYLEDMKKIGASAVRRYARASEFIPEIVSQVKTLIRKGYAYKIEGDGYYFDVSRFKDYGKLSRRTTGQAEDAVSRIDENIKKRSRADFALWKFIKTRMDTNEGTNGHEYRMKIIDGEPAWATPLGWGRPGWHIEDTAITEKFFGPQYDVHGGAVDLKFPHHEAEIAQQEAASGKKPFVKIWMHSGFLLIEGKKMSKSLKNFITIRDFLKKYPAEVLRWLVLTHHYRSPLDYSSRLADEAAASFRKIGEFAGKLLFISRTAKPRAGAKDGAEQGGAPPDKNFPRALQACRRSFEEAMADDLNTPLALAAIFELEAKFQKTMWRFSRKNAKAALGRISNILKSLGIGIKTPPLPLKISKLAKERELFRNRKQFIQADALRKKIRVLGYEVEDTPIGPLVRRKS